MRALLFLLLAIASQAYEIIEGEFFLGLKPDNDVSVFGQKLKNDFNLEVKKVWDIKRTKILWVLGDEAAAISASKLPEIKYMSYNGWAHAHQDECEVTPHPGVWGLDRTDQREALSYTDPTSPLAIYEHGMNTGFGVNAYITDTGIDITHSTFGGRAVWGYTADGVIGEDDGNGHGTHVSGTIGGIEYGLAKEVSLIAVKVLSDSGSGPWSATLDGLSWIQQQHQTSGRGSVVNMSLGGTGEQEAIEDLITQMFAEGVSFGISAGNSDNDACNYTPARTPDAVTVAATDVEDVTASFTNYGSCVDIHAPGVTVRSSVPNEGTDEYSGTSMSAPHVVGVMARYISSFGEGNPPPAQDVTDWLLAQATVDAVTFRPGHESSPNLLLYASCSMASPK
ncbi:hypothetical protein LSH36_1599g00000 [Paralvinella palmiformis]|uniref:Peptidase S8/S53 domain-containing protein n=1 Tax=Paralvinella palmiformis TaxID=53620 RepID=A0AAD9MPW3_9ANNE|nr:hypothetical protein LSH36_1599g00000 [Paralvinella palmiformis]